MNTIIGGGGGGGVVVVVIVVVIVVYGRDWAIIMKTIITKRGLSYNQRDM